MGFYIRKSVRVGALRFNLSKSGIGVSAGIPGFRIGTGPRGTYVHAGRGGLYYRGHISSGTRRTPARSRLDPGPHAVPTGGGFTEIVSAPAESISDESSQSVLEAIQSRRRVLPWTPFGVVLAISALIACANAAPDLIGLVLVISMIGLVFSRLRDAEARTTVLMYELEEDALNAFRGIHDAFSALMSCARVWNVDAAGGTANYKYDSGASELLKRRIARVAFAQPPGIRTNLPIPSMTVRDETLYFFPERIFVVGRSGIGAVTYSQLEGRIGTTRFIETEGVPRDARVVDHTWRYLNKNGSPDRRFSNNRQIPIAVYGQLFLASVSGLRAYLQTSRDDVPVEIMRALDVLRQMNAAAPERSSAALI